MRDAIIITLTNNNLIHWLHAIQSRGEHASGYTGMLNKNAISSHSKRLLTSGAVCVRESLDACVRA